MITIFKIIYWHSKECERTDLKKIGIRKFHCEKCEIELLKSELNDFKKNKEFETGLKVDLYYKTKN